MNEGNNAPPVRWSGQWSVRVRLLLSSMAFWVAWFAIARALFFGRHWALVPASDRPLVAQSFWHGARMDLSAAAYLTAVLWLVLLFSVTLPSRVARLLLRSAGLVAITFVSVATLTDVGTFGPWRRRLDATLWDYLASPREAYASAETIAVGPLLGLLALVLLASWWLYRRAMRTGESRLAPVRGLPGAFATGALMLSGLPLIIPLRGGVQWTPLNESTVFFSNSEVVNQGALNAAWYLLYSTIRASKTATSNPFAMLTDAEVSTAVDSLYPVTPARTPSLLRIARPNVILIIWESFTAKVVARLGGRPNVTPQFDRWTHQGIFFDSVFASGERSAQGLVAILSGFPSIPRDVIMNRPAKSATLPQLARVTQRAGYTTSFVYGGELAFANMKSYVLSGGYDRITGIEQFASAQRNSKWGVHDHVVLARALRDVATEPRPFFTSIFTLSSHEPFEVPVATIIPGNDESSLFMNAHHYTDASIGAFLDSASRAPWWDSTLVVIIADHGSPLPVPSAGPTETVASRHHIPMLWVGGALRVRDTVVHRIGASVDLAPTLLAQLGLRADGFRWGRDVLRPAAEGFAYFAHQDGFAFIDRAGWLVYDERAHRVTEHSPRGGRRHFRNGSALLQATFADYLAR